MAKISLATLREEMRAVARGDREISPLPAADVLGALSSQGNLDLLKAINQFRPESVSALARLTGRAQSIVSRSLQQLARHNLIRLDRDGKEVRPVPLTAKIDINLANGTYHTVPMAAE
jgi:predicted transcriptional regulator